MELEQAKLQQCYVINQYTVKTVLNTNLKNAMHNEQLWHKVLIEKVAGFNAEDVLDSIIKLASPYELIAVNMKIVNKNDIEFICNSCGSAIETLCKTTNLILRHSKYMFPITVTIGYSDVNNLKIDIKNELLNIISSNNRYDPKDCVLNLSSFITLKGIKDLIYSNFKNTNGIIFILSLFKWNEINILDLSGNAIETIDERFVTHSTTKNIISIDLKYNKIKTLEDIVPLKLMNIKEVTITDNPICDCYENAVDYVFAIKKLIPSLEILDGIQVDSLLTALPRIPYYVTSKSAEYLIDQFLEHYFTVYDNTNSRRSLQHLYHPNAIFSMSSLIVAFDIDSEYGLQKYDTLAHNLLKWNKSDYDFGPECIMKKLCYLPQVEHDPQSFCVDVLSYIEDTSVVFVVNGTFREPKQEPIMYNFTRTFVLLAGEDGAYDIINDMLYVSNAEPESIRTAFSDYVLNDHLKIPLKSASSENEKVQFISSFSELTTLHEDYSKEYLDLCNWNFREALEKFVYNIQFNLIPRGYFTSGFNVDPVEMLKTGPIDIHKLDKGGVQRVLSHFNIKTRNRCNYCPLKPKWCSGTHWKQIRHDLLRLARRYQLPIP